jgi:hypothetical protein
VNDVDFVINVYERTYRSVLSPGYIRQLTSDNLFRFRRVIVIINNVTDSSVAASRAKTLLDIGEIDSYVFVSDHIDNALRMAGLEKRDLGSIAYYSDWAFVTLFFPQIAPWICHWDAEVRLKKPIDWISPAIDLMNRSDKIAVANPFWSKGNLDQETLYVENGFSVGYGFSDQVFLLRRSEFAQPIYRYFAPASLRYPLAHISAIFEQRVDAYMRTKRRLRATHQTAQYIHSNEGNSYPRTGPKESAIRLLIKVAVTGMRMLPTMNPRWKPYL